MPAHASRSVDGTARADRPPWTVAIATVASNAHAASAEADARIEAALSGRTVTFDAHDLVSRLPRTGRLTLNFHPDRRTRSGHTVAEGLRDTGRYVSQFVTGTSNGSRSAVPGGDRAGWEQRMFGAAYECASAIERPVYGALDLTLDPHGGSPRFGSSFLVLQSHVVERATFCVGDSHLGPTDVGTAAEFTPIAAGLAEQAARGRLFARPLDLTDLAALVSPSGARVDDSACTPSRSLDGYVEAQVHGGVDLAADVEAIVLDPSFVGTEVERVLRDAAAQFGFDLRWHGGSILSVAAVPADLRGPTMPALARRVAAGADVIDAAAIGRAAALIDYTAPTATGDAAESDLQQLKYLWHILLALGHDAPARAQGAQQQ